MGEFERAVEISNAYASVDYMVGFGFLVLAVLIGIMASVAYAKYKQDDDENAAILTAVAVGVTVLFSIISMTCGGCGMRRALAPNYFGQQGVEAAKAENELVKEAIDATQHTDH